MLVGPSSAPVKVSKSRCGKPGKVRVQVGIAASLGGVVVPPGGYTPERVIELIPHHYDPDVAGSFSSERGDAMLPRAATNPSEKGTGWAELADINYAFAHAGLSVDERKALLLVYGVWVTLPAATVLAGFECVDETVGYLRSGLAKLVDAANRRETF